MARALLGAGLAAVIGTAACAPAAEGPDPAVLAAVAARSPAEYQEGKELYALYCAMCHGKSGGGSVVGPPLVHRVYRPAHHADAAFLLAVKNGVRAHHWRFGDMAPVPGVDVAASGHIVAYLRWLQVENGIE